jgi:anhydro-N-acetylmuramic acid kinase
VRGLFVGIMSGTSLDGADAVLADFSAGIPAILAFASAPFPTELRQRLLALSEPGRDSLDLAGEACLELAERYADVAAKVMARASVKAGDVAAIGCHGQTVRHRPGAGFTIQLNDPARIAELAGIDVVADFRRRDMAAGGQGAPLVPAFHAAAFRHESLKRAIVNIGGISNVSLISPEGLLLGYDCGPGNVLMDTWAGEGIGKAFDESGRWASSGSVIPELLEQMLTDPYLLLPPPKSTGREHFNRDWLLRILPKEAAPADVQATLTEFTASSIIRSIDRFCPGTEEIYICGGGAKNRLLMSRLAQLGGKRPVRPTDDLGVPAGQVEPVAFAWLAMKCVRREPVDMTKVTGARHPCVMGAIYHA